MWSVIGEAMSETLGVMPGSHCSINIGISNHQSRPLIPHMVPRVNMCGRSEKARGQVSCPQEAPGLVGERGGQGK